MTGCGCTTVTYAQVCTLTPGIVHETGDAYTMCPPESDCDDAVMHRPIDGSRDWHTAAGTTPEQWYAARLP